MVAQRILVIAEKPALATDVANAIAGPYKKQQGFLAAAEMDITYGFGHLIGLVDAKVYDPRYEKWNLADLPVLPRVYQKAVPVDKKTKKPNARAVRQLDIIGQLLKQAKLVIHVGDPDREGQLIVDELLEYFNWRGPVQRMWLNAQTPSGIKHAYKSMKDNSQYADLTRAAKAREELDWLIGVNGTRGYSAIWRKKGHDGMLIVGRVKSAVIGLVEMREREIEAFVRVPFYVVRANLSAALGSFVGIWKRRPDAGPPQFDAEGRLLQRSVAEAVRDKCEGQTGVVRKADTAKGKRTAPPLLFSLGELQKVANKLGYSPDSTLEAAQELYETYKLTTYPRTSCQYAPESIWREAARVIDAVKSNFGAAWPFGSGTDPRRKSAAFDDKMLDAHFAIMPTTQKADLSQLPGRERAIYIEIVKRFLAQFHGDYVYDSTAVEIVARDEVFEQRGIVPVEQGWRVLYPAPTKVGGNVAASAGAVVGNTQNGDQNGPAALPPLTVGESVRLGRIIIEDSVTSPPPRFNGATLIEAMERIDQFVDDPGIKRTLRACGLGTEATRGPTLGELVSVGFLEEVRDGRTNVYVPTPIARAYARVLSPELTKPDFTAQLEDRLAAVAGGSLTSVAFGRFAHDIVHKLVEQLKDGTVERTMPTPAELPPAVVIKRGKGGSGGKNSGTRKATSRQRSNGAAPGSRVTNPPTTSSKATSASAPKPASAPTSATARPAGNPFSLK
ncbi:TraE [Burkholderia gladioli]|uniref:DNA topoisomerase n=1 Tax=Burkholderia gladioli TaxID=28095 RepID=A0A2A7SAJ9_BURGA|nr:DNA topoisomerase [Burkholderia gladioli]PEH40473.1 TraE [Burkholderia gladioli]